MDIFKWILGKESVACTYLHGIRHQCLSLLLMGAPLILAGQETYPFAQHSNPGFDTIDPYPGFSATLGYVRPYDEIALFHDGSIAVAAKMKPLIGPAHYATFKYNSEGVPLQHQSFGLYPRGFEVEMADFTPLDSGSIQVSATGLVGTTQVRRVYRTLKLSANLDSLSSTGYRTEITPLTYSPGFTSKINGFSFFQDFDTKVYDIPNIKASLDSNKRAEYNFYSFDDRAHIYHHFFSGKLIDTSYLVKREKATGQFVSMRSLAPGVLKIHAFPKGFYLVCADTNSAPVKSVVIKKVDTAFNLQNQVKLSALLPQKHTLLKKGRKQAFTALDTSDHSLHIVYGDYAPNGPGYFGNWSYDLGVLRLDSSLNIRYQTSLKRDTNFYYLPEDLKVTPHGSLVLSLGAFPHSTYAGARLRLVKINASGQIGLDENPLKNTQPISIYPTRFQSQLTIRGLSAFRYRLSDLQGRKLEEGLLPKKTGEKVHQLKLPQQLPAGPYLLRLETLDGKRTHLQRLLKPAP